MNFVQKLKNFLLWVIMLALVLSAKALLIVASVRFSNLLIPAKELPVVSKIPKVTVNLDTCHVSVFCPLFKFLSRVIACVPSREPVRYRVVSARDVYGPNF